MNLERIEWAFGTFLVLAATVVCLVPLREMPAAFDLNDKVAHMIGHGGLAAYFTGLVPRRRWWNIFVLLMIFGIGIELAQHYMQLGRNGDPRDLIANLIGVSAGLLAGLLGIARWPELLAWLVRWRGTAP
jgi:VanZ family protein